MGGYWGFFEAVVVRWVSGLFPVKRGGIDYLKVTCWFWGSSFDVVYSSRLLI